MPNIPMPEGFELPEGVKEGDEFDAVGTFVMSKGSLTLKAVDGSPIPGYESEDETSAADAEEDMAEQEGEAGGEEDFLSGIERRMSKKSEMA